MTMRNSFESISCHGVITLGLINRFTNDVFRPFSTFGICYDRLVILSEYIMDNKEKCRNDFVQF